MFELYDIFDDNEINIIILFVLIVILITVVIILGYKDYTLKNKVNKLQEDMDIINSEIDGKKHDHKHNDDDDDDDDDYDKKDLNKKIKELIKEKKVKESKILEYAPSEYATLLKYNPILPYSAFTMDIINNSYLDYNEKNMYDDRYFALSNYDNIYDPDSKKKSAPIKTTSKATDDPNNQLYSNNSNITPNNNDQDSDF